MRTTIFIMLTLSFLLGGVGGFNASAFAKAEAGMIDVGNKFCPVSGDEVSGKHFVVYQGKRYGLCCPMCEEKFKKNPEKYLAKMKEQEAAEDKPHASGEDHHH